MSEVAAFLTRRRGGSGWHFTDVLAMIWLASGLILMFGPAVWLTLSSFKTPAALVEFPPTLLPLDTRTAIVEGHDKPLPLYSVATEEGGERVLAQVRRIGTVAQMVDPAAPGEIVKVPIDRAHAGARASLRRGELRGAVRAVRFPHLHEEFRRS